MTALQVLTAWTQGDAVLPGYDLAVNRLSTDAEGMLGWHLRTVQA